MNRPLGPYVPSHMVLRVCRFCRTLLAVSPSESWGGVHRQSSPGCTTKAQCEPSPEVMAAYKLGGWRAAVDVFKTEYDLEAETTSPEVQARASVEAMAKLYVDGQWRP